MKKITFLFLSMLFFATSWQVNAQYLSEGFEGGTFPPTGWTQTQTNANDTWKISDVSPHSGTNSAQCEYDEGLGAQDESFMSPVMDLSSAVAPTLTFWFNMSYYWGVDPNDNYDIKVLATTDGGTSTTELWTEVAQGEFTNWIWYEITIDLSGYNGESNLQLIFNYTGTDGAEAKFDDILVAEPPTCLAPSDLSAGSITLDSAQLAWTENGTATAWDVEILPSGDTPTETGVAATNPYDATGLESATAYDFYVRATCGGGDGDSVWVGPFTFSTLIPPPACGGNYYDSGGTASGYQASESTTITISPENSGDAVTVTFTYVDIETSTGDGNQDGCYDYLSIYDGPDTSATVLAATKCGEESGDGNEPSVAESLLSIGDSFTSTHATGALTFVFTSDGSVQETGWEADVTCATVGVEDLASEGFRFYPNPVVDELNMSAFSKIEQVSVLNMLGQIVKTVTPSNIDANINVSNLSSGSYFVKVQIGEKVGTFKVIKE